MHAEPLQYEFDERAGGTVQLLGADGSSINLPAASDVSGLRVLLADEDSARADAVAQSLRGHGATVVVTDFNPPEQRFARLRQLDPAILLIDEAGLRGAGYQLVRRMRRDTRLRWASLLVVRWDEIWSDTEGSHTQQLQRTLGTPLSALVGAGARAPRTRRDGSVVRHAPRDHRPRAARAIPRGVDAPSERDDSQSATTSSDRGERSTHRGGARALSRRHAVPRRCRRAVGTARARSSGRVPASSGSRETETR